MSAPQQCSLQKGRKKEQLTIKIRLASSLNNSDLEEGWAQKEKIWKVYFRLRISNATTFMCVLLFDRHDSISSLLWKI